MGTRYTAVFYAAAGIDTDEIGQRLAHAVEPGGPATAHLESRL